MQRDGGELVRCEAVERKVLVVHGAASLADNPVIKNSYTYFNTFKVDLTFRTYKQDNSSVIGTR